MTVTELMEFKNTLQQALKPKYRVMELCIESDPGDEVQVRISVATPGHGIVQCHVPFTEVESSTVEAMITQIAHFLERLFWNA